MTGFRPNDLEDTIMALATPPGRGALGIIRVSGDRTGAILKAVFQPATPDQTLTSHHVRLGHIVSSDSGEVVDQVLVTLFKSPHSYTGQDVAEISFHGSPLIAGTILESLSKAGARPARPGEFTLRAFLTGKMDLTQAEAVRDLIDARTTEQLLIAERQLEGNISRNIRPLKTRLIGLISRLETCVEFSEDLPESTEMPDPRDDLEDFLKHLSHLEDGFRLGSLYRDGITMVITGRTNVGKSTLFNRLLGHDRAIVTELPGTTRDVLREPAHIHGIPVTLIDTAGVRATADPVEKIGVERTHSAIADADLVLHVIDGSRPWTDEDAQRLDSLSNHTPVVVLNKGDLPPAVEAPFLQARYPDLSFIPVSALTGDSFEDLADTLFTHLTSGRDQVEPSGLLIGNLRQQNCIRETRRQVQDALEAATNHLSEEFLLLHLRRALSSLDELTGITTVEDILDKIFSTFCIGK